MAASDYWGKKDGTEHISKQSEPKYVKFNLY